MTEPGVAQGTIEPLAVALERRYIAEPAHERDLIKRAQRGSAYAIEELVRTYWGDAHRIALGVLADRAAAEDVAQEALLAAIRSLSSFDRKRPFRPWLHRIATNRSLDWLRTRERRAEARLPDEAADVAVVDAAGPAAEVMDLLRSLGPEERAVVVLRHLLGLNSREIGEVLDKPEGTVRSILSRALARLRTELGGETDSDD